MAWLLGGALGGAAAGGTAASVGSTIGTGLAQGASSGSSSGSTPGAASKNAGMLSMIDPNTLMNMKRPGQQDDPWAALLGM